MFGSKTPNPKKALRLETKGDRFFQKSKFEKAFCYYQKSEKFDSKRPEIYQKLHETFQKIDKEWTQEDFELSMSWTMQQQELEHPEIKSVHEKFSEEYQTVQKLVQRLMLTPQAADEERLLAEILSYGESAPRPILDFLISLKKAAHHSSQEPEPEA